MLQICPQGGFHDRTPCFCDIAVLIATVFSCGYQNLSELLSQDAVHKYQLGIGRPDRFPGAAIVKVVSIYGSWCGYHEDYSQAKQIKETI